MLEIERALSEICEFELPLRWLNKWSDRDRSLDEINANADGPPDTDDPADVTEDPADVTEDPADVTEDPADVTEDPADVTEDPSDVTDNPIDTSDDPIDPTAVPVNEPEAPIGASKGPAVNTASGINIDLLNSFYGLNGGTYTTSNLIE